MSEATITIDDEFEAMDEIDRLGQLAYWAWEAYGEINAEHRGECARFGDSWPGAAIQVRDAHRAALEAEAAWYSAASIAGRLPVTGPELPYVGSDDEPF